MEKRGYVDPDWTPNPENNEDLEDSLTKRASDKCSRDLCECKSASSKKKPMVPKGPKAKK